MGIEGIEGKSLRRGKEEERERGREGKRKRGKEEERERGRKGKTKRGK